MLLLLEGNDFARHAIRRLLTLFDGTRSFENLLRNGVHNLVRRLADPELLGLCDVLVYLLLEVVDFVLDLHVFVCVQQRRVG